MLSMHFNQAAIIAQRMMNLHYSDMNKHLIRISSGYRINSAADDPAGLAVSERMRSQIYGLEQANKNVLDGISMFQVADAGLSEALSIFQRIRVLALQAANGAITDEDRNLIQYEVTELVSEVSRILTSTEFNSLKLLTSSAGVSQPASLHIGPNANQTLEINLPDLSDSTLNLSSINVSALQNAESSITSVDSAIRQILSSRAQIGAKINRLEHIMNFNSIYKENISAAESRIRDADIAEEISGFIKSKILAEAAQMVFIQANRLQRSLIMTLLEQLNSTNRKVKKNF